MAAVPALLAEFVYAELTFLLTVLVILALGIGGATANGEECYPGKEGGEQESRLTVHGSQSIGMLWV